jgi:transaldolase
MTENAAITTPLDALTEAGVAVWLDDLSRERLRTGNLEDLTRTRRVVG